MAKSTDVVLVNYNKGTEKIPMGRIALPERSHMLFEYTPDFLQSGLELSPFMLPLKPGVITCTDRTFDGLFGVFNDSLPDGWGRLLLDRKLMCKGINPGMLTPLNRLCYVGKYGMGALTYEPDINANQLAVSNYDLDVIENECLQFLENDNDKFIDELLAMNGSSAGARPKILITLIGDNSSNDWLIKFRSYLDPIDIGPIEYAYHLMAIAAGLDVPEAKLFNAKNGHGYFGVQRFDHTPKGALHMHTISGLLHADHKIPSLDYSTIMKVSLRLTRNITECEKQFRNAVFNVLSHNRDDHAKNFSFLMDTNGTWRVSPAYDLTHSLGPAGEHCTTIMGEGKNPSLQHLLKLADICSINPHAATEIIEDVIAAVRAWQDFANTACVTAKSTRIIKESLNTTINNLSG